MKRVCAWCSKVMEEGKPDDLVTHGACETCAEAEWEHYLKTRAAKEAAAKKDEGEKSC